MILPSTALVTGSAGFIGFHCCRNLLLQGWKVIGVDNLSDYYDVALKESRESLLREFENFTFYRASIEESGFLLEVFESNRPELVIHLAAQAGVRYSVEMPRLFVNTNILGTFELLEAARIYKPKHLMIASTSSAYGANTIMPYAENHKADEQMSLYAASKKATENIAHSYSHLYEIPTSVFRFFTVYGPWGRPDMALFKFTKAIIEGEPIDIYNYGRMERDFTYIEDLVASIISLSNVVPHLDTQSTNPEQAGLSSVAPFRVINIGNGKPAKLMEFVESIEECIGKKAIYNFLPIQAGDVPSTWADNSLLQDLIGRVPSTPISKGIKDFVDWYCRYYEIDTGVSPNH